MSGAVAAAGRVAPGAPAAAACTGSGVWALWGSYAALSVFVVMFLVPPFYMVMTSLKSSAEISAQLGNPWLVQHPTLAELHRPVHDADFRGFFLNSAMITAATVAVSMVISVLAAFGLARMGFKGSHTLATGVFLTYLIPNSLLFIPLFQLIGALGLINNVWALALIYPTLAVPFCTWIMIGYFSSIPKELDEAALIDGAGYLKMLWTIFIPGGAARHHRRDDLRLHGELGRVSLSDGLSLFLQPDGADRRHRQRPDPRRRVPVGQDHGRLRVGRGAAHRHLCLPDGLLHRRPDRRRHQGVIPGTAV